MRLRRMLLVGLIPVLTSACVLPAPAIPKEGSARGPEVLDARGSFTLANGMEVLVI